MTTHQTAIDAQAYYRANVYQ